MEPQRIDPNLGMSPALPAVSGSIAPPTATEPAYQPAANAAGQASIPVAAEDSDMIEQEWVAAVKRTLEQYKHDPYMLSRAMTALRQDYLLKRYGRTVEAAK